MTAQDALVWFGAGVPICALLLVLVDRAGRGGAARPAAASSAPRAEHAASLAPVGLDLRGEVTVPGAPTGRPVAAAPVDLAPEPRRSPRPVAVLEATVRPPRPMRNPWAPGDSLHRPLANGAAPAAPTVRKRAWSAYAMIAPVDLYGDANLERLQRGRPPLRYNPLAEASELMQVHIDDVGHARLHWGDDEACDPFESRA